MQQKNYISQDSGFFSGFEPPPAPRYAGTKEASNTLPPSPNTGTAGSFFVTDGQSLGAILDASPSPVLGHF